MPDYRTLESGGKRRLESSLFDYRLLESSMPESEPTTFVATGSRRFKALRGDNPFIVRRNTKVFRVEKGYQ